MWTSTTTASFLWSLNALRWVKAPSSSGRRITRPSQTPHVWLLSRKRAGLYNVVIFARFFTQLPSWPSVIRAFCLILDVCVSRTRAIFNSPSLDDLGTYSCVVTNTDGISSSYTLTEEGESAACAIAPRLTLCSNTDKRRGLNFIYILYINYIFLNALKQWSEQLSLAG